MCHSFKRKLFLDTKLYFNHQSKDRRRRLWIIIIGDKEHPKSGVNIERLLNKHLIRYYLSISNLYLYSFLNVFIGTNIPSLVDLPEPYIGV